MEFLKEILGEELFNQFSEKVNSWNGNEANKEKLVKLANLSTGEYVGKGKYDSEIEKLNNIISGKDTEIETANNLIADLKKGTKGNEELQGKITTYETQVADLQAELAETKLKSAIKVALLSEKAVDVGYLTFKLNEKLKEKGETLELDENDNIKGWDDRLKGLKTQFPNMFESGEGGNGGYKPFGNGGLPKGGHDNSNEPKSLEDALRMQYEGNGE
ncbi:MAG: phage scaffolding protein [Anaerovoracaceae bacterium]|nr:phage scaffolding protein [Anaerovoracaceae bacterium]